MKRITILSAAFLLAISFSCQQDDANPSDSIDPSIADQAFQQNFGNAISRDFMGHIVDVNNNSIIGATVKIGSASVQTDQNGFFVINDAEVFEKFALISVTKPGFVEGSRSIVPTNGRNNIKIMMLPLTPVATIQSGFPSEVTLASGTKVAFDGDFEYENGSAYSGDVHVAMYHLMPGDENLAEIMPGMLYGRKESGDPAALITYGMLNVELRSTDGQKLQIAEGHKAGIEMIIENSQLASAPATIPLWHFDQQTGYWKEDGVATKTGNKYVGEVSHFSWWNLDWPVELTYLELTVTNGNGQPLTYQRIKVTSAELSSISGLRTNFEGKVAYYVPMNTVLEVSVITPCGEVPISQIGAFTESQVSETVTFDAPNATIITGNALNCNGELLSNGYLLFQYNGFAMGYPISNGQVSIQTYLCEESSEFTLFAVDFETASSSSFSTNTLVAPQTAVSVVSTCEETVATPLEGSYTVIVTNNLTGAVRTNANEIITALGPNTYQTSSVALYGPGQIAPGSDSFEFFVSGATITVPTQNLGQYWGNIVSEVPGVISSILNEDSFTITYKITYAAGDRTFTAIYNRN